MHHLSIFCFLGRKKAQQSTNTYLLVSLSNAIDRELPKTQIAVLIPYMTDLLPTCNQLERDLSQSIKALYREQITYPPQKITCKLFSRYLAIVGDEALTPLEKNLWGLGKEDLSEKIRFEINELMKPKLVELLENMLSVKIEEILNEVTFSINKSGILVILSEPPAVRNAKSLPKYKKKLV